MITTTDSAGGAGGRGAPASPLADGLKMNSAQMKTTELTKFLHQAVNESDTLPLSEAEQQLYATLHLAVMAYEDETRFGHPPAERRCMICGVSVSRCFC